MTLRVCEPDGTPPRVPRWRGTDVGVVGGVDEEGFVEQRLGDDFGGEVGGPDEDRHVEVAPHEGLEQLAGGGHSEVEVDVGVSGAKCPDGEGPVVDGDGVDGAEADVSGGAGAAGPGPAGEVAGGGDDPACVGEHLGGVGAQQGLAAATLEQRQAHPAFELGQALGEGRRGDAESGGCCGPGGGVGGGHEVLELLDGEVREHREITWGGHVERLQVDLVILNSSRSCFDNP